MASLTTRERQQQIEVTFIAKLATNEAEEILVTFRFRMFTLQPDIYNLNIKTYEITILTYFLFYVDLRLGLRV